MTTPRDAGVTVYRRPGCPYCMMLRHGLRRAGITFDEIDIWQDPAAAAFVRSVADGNETVPTVTVGGITVVNPSTGDVVELAGEHAPDALPAADETPAPRGWRGWRALLRRSTRSTS